MSRTFQRAHQLRCLA